MKKLYTLSIILLTSLTFGQAFTGTYDFAGIVTVAPATSPANGLIDPTPVPVAPGVTFGSFSAVISSSVVTPPTGSTGAGRFSYSNQPTGATTGVDTYSTLTGAVDSAVYFEVTLTPQTGSSLSLSQMTFKSQRSGTGVRTFVVRSSADNFTANLPASVTSTTANVQPNNVFFVTSDLTTGFANISAGNTITLNNTNVTTPLKFRFYGYNSEATGGSFSIDDVAFTGTTQPALATKQNTIVGLKVYTYNNNLYVTSDSTEAKSVLVYNLLGKQVVNTKVNNQAINVADMSSGIYIVKVTENGKTNTVKVVIQ